MGLFDIFRRKSDRPVANALSLEMLVQKAVTEPVYRVEFYKRLLSDDLVVMTQKSALPEGIQILKTDTKVSILTYPDGRIPIFTSTERIFDKGIVKEQVEYMKMKGENMFDLTKGATLLLNPYSDYGKELLPEEVDKMLNGTILTASSKTLTIEKSTKVQIGQPAVYPTEIVNSLKILFASRPGVKAAYLGWIFNPESGDPPHYIFGIDADDDLQSVMQEAGYAAKQFLPDNELVDLIQVDNKGGLSNYFLNSVEPFYRRVT